MNPLSEAHAVTEPVREGSGKARLCIGLPVYNGERDLGRALDSLLGQDYRDFRLVISDNGSTDKTSEICSRYAERDPRITYLREEVNRGAMWNFNRVLGFACEATYFMWAAHDDQWTPDCVSSCIRFLGDHPKVGLCGTQASIHSLDGRDTGEVDEGLSTLNLDPAERALHYARRVHRNSIFYGIYRACTLGDLAMKVRVGADHILLFELALRTEFHTLPVVKIRRQTGGDSAVLARLLRSIPMHLSLPALFVYLDIYQGFWEVLFRSSQFEHPERFRLTRELLGILLRRHYVEKLTWARIRRFLKGEFFVGLTWGRRKSVRP